MATTSTGQGPAAPRKRLFLIDGSSYFFRAFYAIGHLSNAEGMPTNAVFGFVNMLNKIIADQKPDYVAMIFDSKAPSFRKKIYPDYKANRSEMPEELAVQIPYIKDIVRAHRMAQLEMEGFEADDIIATLTKRFASPDVQVVIVTGDKDLMQLVNADVTVFETMRGEFFNAEHVKEKFGVGPEALLDALALAGDSSDNIPGVPGIGMKTAAALIDEFKSLDALLAHPEKVNGKSKAEKLKTFADQARLSKQLATLHSDVPVECDLAALAPQQPDTETLRALYRKLDLKKFIAALDQSGAETSAAPTIAAGSEQRSREAYRLITDIEELQRYLGEVREKCLPLSVDLETTSKIPMRAEIVGISMACEMGQGIYVPVGHRGSEIAQPALKEVLAILKGILEDERVGKRGQNIKYDDVIFRRHGIAIKNIAFDTMLASYLIDAQARGLHNLDDLCAKHLSHKTITYDEVTEGIEDRQFALVPVEKALQYAAEDADMVLCLEEKLRPMLQEQQLLSLLTDVELPVSSILAEMEVNGIEVDRKRLGAMSQEFDVELKGLISKIYESAGEEFTINSPKQLQKILFDKMNLPRGKKTKTGYSTDTEVLADLARIHELPNMILRYRVLTKLKSTYIDSLPDLIHPETGRIHTHFNQAVAATGRLSSSDPNMQNIPVRGAEGQLIRAAFVPRQGWEFLGADYSQIELRIFAHFSEDPTLLRAYREHEDIHSLTAQAVFHVEAKDVTDDMRRKAKVVNFGILYGMSEFRLARELGISNQEGREFIEGYFAGYPGVRKFIDSTIAEARKSGFVKTYLGRRRATPDLNNKNFNLRKAAERAACSTTVQGSAADLIKSAMIQVDRRMKKQGLKSKMLLQVHDELVFEVPPDERQVMQKLVTEEMQNVWTLRVPLEVQSQFGTNWLEAH